MRSVRADAWRLNVLGPVELCYEGQPVAVSGVTRTLLALLARTPGEEVNTASIVAGIWGSEPPEDSEKEVASNISRLRRALTVVAPDVDPTSVVVTMPSGYILAVEPSNADILAFERLAADGQRALSVGQPALASARLDAALALWRGPAYADFDDHAFVSAEAARLEDLRLAVIEFTIDARLAQAAPSAPPELLSELPELLGQHWHRERLWVQWMTVLFRLDQRADALSAFRQAQDLLSQRLSAQPGPDLRAAEHAVTVRDQALYGQPIVARAVPAPLDTGVPTCVGREEELAWLSGALDLAATRRAQARLIVGSPGIGKSRIVAELAQRAAARGIPAHYWQADTTGLDTFTPSADAVTLVVIEDLDQATHDEVARVTGFIRATLSRPVVTLLTCRDPVRVGDLASLPKLVLSALDDEAIADIVRVYAPTVTDGMAIAAMTSTGGIPARIHRSASEWAFARAGRRIDRAVVDAVEPTRRLAAVSDDVIGGVLDLAHVRAQARPLRPVTRDLVARPYKGLSTFDIVDAEIFHGRDQLIAELVSKLVQRRLLAVVGDAGTGKSSLVRAGLLPALASGVLPASSRWRQVIVRPSIGGPLAEQVAPHLDDLRRVELNFDDLYLDAAAPTEVAGYAPEAGGYAPEAGGYVPEPGGYAPEAGDYPSEAGGYGVPMVVVPAQRVADESVDPVAAGTHDTEQTYEIADETADVDVEPGGDPHLDADGVDGGADEITGGHVDDPPSDPSSELVNGDAPLTNVAESEVVSDVEPGIVADYEQVELAVSFVDESRLDEPYESYVDTDAAVVEAEPVPSQDSILLVVDQFEEVFTILDAAAREAFLDTVVELAERNRVVLTLRADFYARCAHYPAFAHLLTANTVLMRQMTDAELRRAIELPAAAAGLELEPGLTDQVVADARRQPDLAHLSTALYALWETRISAALTIDGYEATGGVPDALANLAEGAFATLTSAPERDAARRIMLRLSAVTDADALVRRQASLAEVVASAGPAAPAALEKLAAGRLVAVSEATVEVTHEVVLECWPQVRIWLEDERAERAQRRHLAEAAQAWFERGRPLEPPRSDSLRNEPGALYRGARLAAAVDLLRQRPDELSLLERDFLDAGQRQVLAAEVRRKRRMVRLWRYLVACIAVTLLAIVVAAVAVTLQLRSAAAGERADGQRMASMAVAEPDLRKALLLAVAATQLDDSVASSIRTVLLGSPDVVAATGTDITTVAVSPDGRTVAAATTGGTIWLYGSGTLATVGRLDVSGQGPVNGLAFTPDSRRLVSWGGARNAQTATSIVVWDLAGKVPVGPAFGQSWPDAGGGLLADGTTLLVAQHGSDAGKAPTAVAWNLDARTPSTAYELPTTGIDGMQLSRDGRYVVLGTPGGSEVIDVTGGTSKRVDGAVKPLAVSPDGQTLLTADAAVLDVWNLATGQRTGRAVRHSADVDGAAWSPDGDRFASVGADGLVIVWDARTLQPIKALAGHGDAVRVVRFGADGSMVYTVGADGSLFAWDLTGTRGVAAKSGANTTSSISLACALAGRDLTPEEWKTYLPQRSYRHVCPA